MTSMLIFIATILAWPSGRALAQESCGWQAGGATCANGVCCSQFGYCGSTFEYCGDGCQSQCGGGGGGGGGGGVASIVSSALFDQMLNHRNDNSCPAQGFYTYDAFIAAANSFSGFGTTGDVVTQKREIAAFLAQTSHETTGGWGDAPDGPYAWGYCFIEEPTAFEHFYCVPSVEWPCVLGKKYYGRGPIQLTYNYNYGQAGKYLGLDLLADPDLVATNATLSFETALWFWMTPQSPKPSCHDVITNNWTPSADDQSAGRLAGYGGITNIINGVSECGHGPDSRVADRIGFYKRYCDILEISAGDNLDCYDQEPFGYSAQLSARAAE